MEVGATPAKEVIKGVKRVDKRAEKVSVGVERENERVEKITVRVEKVCAGVEVNSQCQLDSPDNELISSNRQHLSVDIEMASFHMGIPTLVLRQMWLKAIDLLFNNQVLVSPGSSPFSRMVASFTKKRPHFAKLKMVVLNVMVTTLHMS